MPAGNKINNYMDCLDREPHKTILDILATLEKPITLQYLLSILRPFEKNILFPLVDAADIEKLQKVDIQIHTINIQRQRLREILIKLIEVDWIRKETSGKTVKYRILTNSEKWFRFFPSKVEYFDNGNKKGIGCLISIDESIKIMKQEPDGNKKMKELGKNPWAAAMMIQELLQKMLTDFEKKTNQLEIELKDFDIQIKVKRKGELYYRMEKNM